MLPAAVPSGLWLVGILYFVSEDLPPAYWRASAHFLSEISRLRSARDHGGGIARASARSELLEWLWPSVQLCQDGRGQLSK